MALAVPLSRFTSRVGGGSAFFVRQHEQLEAIFADWCIRLRIDWRLHRRDGSGWYCHATDPIIARFAYRWIFGHLRIVGFCAVLCVYLSKIQDISEVCICWLCRDRGFGVGILFMRDIVSTTLMLFSFTFVVRQIGYRRLR